MLERILIPVDGSSRAEAILTHIRPLLRREDSEVVVVRAVEPVAIPSAEGSIFPVPAPMDEADNYVRNCALTLRSQGAQARGIARLGLAAETVLEVAREARSTLIALTTHGRTGLPRWVFGSVAEKILRASDVPVLVARSFVDQMPEEFRFARILVPIDASDASLEVVPHAAELAHLFGSQVYVLHALEQSLAVPVPHLKRAADLFAERGVRVEPVLGQGEPASQILEYVQRLSADLVAMTTHARSGVTRWMLGSVTEKVLRAASVPLLVVRTGRR